MPKKTDSKAELKAEVKAKQEKLLELTAGFCKAHLDAEYKQLTARLINKMARQRAVPFLRGSLENWAGGIIHAIGSINFLSDKSFAPYATNAMIADYFHITESTMAQKSRVIRDMFGLDRGDAEFSTSTMQEQFASLNDMLLQTQTLLLADILQRAGLDPATVDLESLGLQALNPNNLDLSGLALMPPGDEDIVEAVEGEFIDDSRLAMEQFYNLAERYRAHGPTPALQRDLEKLIQQDPDFLDTYALLCEVILAQANECDAAVEAQAKALLEAAYDRAMRLITADTGAWPEVMEWGWLENRHIIRALLNMALAQWTNGATDAALDLLRKLLHTNPGDNVGARHYILAIRQGMSFDEFEARFNKNGFYDSDLPAWFERHSTAFPDEFSAWQAAVGW